METTPVEVVEPSQGEGQVVELSEEEREKREAAEIAEARAIAIQNAKQPYLTVAEEATLRSVHFVKDFFAQIEPLTYKNYKGSIAWETIGIALRFFMGSVNFLHKEDARRAKYEGRKLGLWALRITPNTEFTSELCGLLVQWVSSISSVRRIQKNTVSAYVIGGFFKKKRERASRGSLSNLRSVQLLLCMAEYCQERERAKATEENTHP